MDKPRTSTTEFSHAVDALELPAVLEHIAAKCVSQGGRRRVLSLRPLVEREVIRKRIDMIAELASYHEAAGSVAVSDTAYADWVDRAADNQTVIPPDGLLALAAGERTVRSLKQVVRNEEGEYPNLREHVDAFEVHDSIIAAVEKAVDRDETIRDSASHTLRNVRRSIGRARDDARASSDKLARAFGGAEYATFNGTRYMLLVPRDKVKRREGLVHATSQTGGSLYYEPLDLVEKNNRLETLASEERAEVARILAELTATVMEHRASLLRNRDLWEELDEWRAKALFATDFNCVSPGVSEDTIDLRAARHPLLEMSLRSAAFPAPDAESDTAPTHESAGVGVADDRAPDIGVAGDRAPDVGVTDDRVPDVGVTDNRAPDGWVTSAAAADAATAGEAAPGDVASGEVVPLDLVLTGADRVLVITGPNAGGKTVALKTVGLLTLMFQCGLPVPAADGTCLAIFHRVFADIGDEQSIASSLSTFTSNLRHLNTMSHAAGAETLCLIDEIGDGTDPDEGAALAIATLEHFIATGTAVVATTHYGKVKSFALRSNGVSNASMVFDDDNDRPLYRMLQGTAGRSRGIATARRLHFHRAVIERAAALVGEEAFRLENLLSELEGSRLALERERAAVQSQSERLRELMAGYEKEVKDLSEHRSRHREDARREAEKIVRDARREIEAVVKEIRETQATKTAVKRGRERIEAVARETAPRPTAMPRALAVSSGDMVSLSASGRPAGRVIEVNRGRALVDMNGKRLQVKTSALYHVAADDAVAAQHKPATPVTTSVDVQPLESTTLDVRGEDRAAALERVDRFIDLAVLNGVGEVTIIHGVGEGVLQNAIRDYLARDARIASVRRGRLGEGGDGVSVVSIR